MRNLCNKFTQTLYTISNMQKLTKVVKDLNISIATAVTYLKTRSVEIDENPNARIDDQAVDLLTAEFNKDKLLKSNIEKCRSVLYASDSDSGNVTDSASSNSIENSISYMNSDELRQIISECYEELPSLPGWYRKMENLLPAVKLSLQQKGKDIDYQQLKDALEDLGAIIEPEYIDKTNGKKFEAVKIIKPEKTANLSIEDKTEIREIVKNTIDNLTNTDDDNGWYDFVKLAPKLLKTGLRKEKYGVHKLLPLLKEALGESIEINLQGTKATVRFRLDTNVNSMSNENSRYVNYSKNAGVRRAANSEIAPYMVRNKYREMLKEPSVEDGWVNAIDLMSRVGWNGELSQFKEQFKLQIKSNQVRVPNISRCEIVDDIYFDPTKNPYPQNIEKLRIAALEERWEDSGKRNGILDNYVCYTYARVKEEGKISLSNDKLHGCWNTGLVNTRYLPIYCYMKRKSIQERWVFQGFCTDGEDLGKIMVHHIGNLPFRAEYFTGGNLLFEPDDKNLSTDYGHIITEHPSRLPVEWMNYIYTILGDCKTSVSVDGETPEQFDIRIGKLIKDNIEALSFLQTKLDEAIKVSIMRCQWNYKTAIPYYEPKSKGIGWLLPLCIRKKDGRKKDSLIPFAALVVTKKPSGRYQGETIYKLSWAYRCARLVCRPDSDWLSPSLCGSEDENEDNPIDILR